MMLAKPILLTVSISLAGCAGMKQDQKQALEQTREIALLIKSVGVSTEAFQRQRDAIAVSSQRQRNGLAALAWQQEAELATTLADWNIEGATDRRARFDALRTEANNLVAARNRQDEQARADALELKKVRSAVNFSQAQINGAAVGTMQLGEQASRESEARFLLEFAKATHAKIVNDEQAEIKAQADQIATKTKETKP